eukprot:7445231-Ditylum_brightwellii.AAC.1
MEYKDCFLAQADEEIKEIYETNIKSGNFLSFSKTEEDNLIPYTTYSIKGHLEYSNDMDTRVHFHCIVNGLQNTTLQSPITFNSKILKSNSDDEDDIKPTPEIKLTPAKSMDNKPDEKP